VQGIPRNYETQNPHLGKFTRSYSLDVQYSKLIESPVGFPDHIGILMLLQKSELFYYFDMTFGSYIFTILFFWLRITKTKFYVVKIWGVKWGPLI